MAIIEAISSKANIKRIIRYVTQDKKNKCKFNFWKRLYG